MLLIIDGSQNEDSEETKKGRLHTFIREKTKQDLLEREKEKHKGQRRGAFFFLKRFFFLFISLHRYVYSFILQVWSQMHLTITSWFANVP